jgi:hypothetical protein
VRNGHDHCEAGHENADHLYVSQFPVEKLKRVVSVEWSADVEDIVQHYPDQRRLKQSISEHGIAEPLDLGAPHRGERRYQLLHGNHRAAAAVRLGLEGVPVRIHKAEYCTLFRDWLYPTFEKPGRAMYKRKRWPK